MASSMPEALRAVAPEALEEYVLEQLRRFAVAFAPELQPAISQQQLDLAFSRALYAMNARAAASTTQLTLRFSHACRYVGCASPSCGLCKHNPHKACGPDDNFDEAYADNQPLRSSCETDICVELVNAATGEVVSAPGLEVQLCAVDGDKYDAGAPDPLKTIQTLLTTDAGAALLQAQGAHRAVIPGTVVVPLQGGRARLPDVFLVGKNDNAKFGGASVGTFALMGLAVRRGEAGQLLALDNVGPAVGKPFVVKTQRALNDYRKSAFPHYREPITRVRHIGAVSAGRLRDARAHLGPDVPVACVESVEDLKALVQYALANTKVETKLIEMLNMRGRHRFKWDALCAALADNVVYDDAAARLWMPAGGGAQGLLFHAKQAQVAFDKPAGHVQRVAAADGGPPRLQAVALTDASNPAVAILMREAAAAWAQPGHPGWQVLAEPIEWVAAWTGMPVATSPAAMFAPAAPPMQLAAVRFGVQHMPPLTATPPPRHSAHGGSAMSGGSDGAATSSQHAMPASEEAQDSAFARQQAQDAVALALQVWAEDPDVLRHPSDASDAGTTHAGPTTRAGTAAAAAAAAAGAGGSSAARNKRGRAHPTAAAAGTDDLSGGTAEDRTLYHQESNRRHLPIPRQGSTGGSDAAGATAAALAAAVAAGAPDASMLLELPTELPSLGPSGMPSLGDILQQLDSDVPMHASPVDQDAGAAAAGGSASGGQHQQQHAPATTTAAQAGKQQQRGDLELSNSLRGLNLSGLMLPPAPASCLLPPEMPSLQLLGSILAPRATLRHEDSFRGVLDQLQLGSGPTAGGQLEAMLGQQPSAAGGGKPAAGL